MTMFDAGEIEFKQQLGQVRATCSFGLAFTISFHPNSPNSSTVTFLSPCCKAKLEGSRFSRSHNCVLCLKFHYDLPPLELRDPATLAAWIEPYFPPLEAVLVTAAVQQKIDRFRAMCNRWSMHECGRLSGALI